MADKTVVTHKNFKAWKSVMDLATQMYSRTKKPSTQQSARSTSPS
jgi:hypothetical protein